MQIDGKKLANVILNEIRLALSQLPPADTTPTLAIITVGSQDSWKTYVFQKIKTAKMLGMQTKLLNFPQSISEIELRETIEKLNKDDSVHGIIVQRPLPQDIHHDKISYAVVKEKDIDGFRKDSPFEPPISQAVLCILQEVQKLENTPKPFSEWLSEKKLVVMGRGITGGGPIINTLLSMQIHPGVIGSSTEEKHEYIKQADILICATGKAHIITADMIKRGVILIGIGIARGEDGKLRGEYEEEKIKAVASYYTPTPGGVGPLNLAFLFQNLLKAYQSKN